MRDQTITVRGGVQPAMAVYGEAAVGGVVQDLNTYKRTESGVESYVSLAVVAHAYDPYPDGSGEMTSFFYEDDELPWNSTHWDRIDGAPINSPGGGNGAPKGSFMPRNWGKRFSSGTTNSADSSIKIRWSNGTRKGGPPVSVMRVPEWLPQDEGKHFWWHEGQYIQRGHADDPNQNTNDLYEQGAVPNTRAKLKYMRCFDPRKATDQTVFIVQDDKPDTPSPARHVRPPGTWRLTITGAKSAGTGNRIWCSFRYQIGSTWHYMQPYIITNEAAYTATATTKHVLATTSTWKWTDNPVLHFLHYAYVFSGRGWSITDNFGKHVWWNTAAQAADRCDGLVSIPGGGTEKRWRCDAVVLLDEAEGTDLRNEGMIKGTCLMEVIEDTAGKMAISVPMPAVTGEPIETITLAQRLGPVSGSSNAPVDERANTIPHQFISRDHNWKVVSSPTREDAQAVAKEGVLRRPIVSHGITRNTQAQRLSHQILQLERLKETLNLGTNWSGMRFAPNSVVNVAGLTPLISVPKRYRVKAMDANHNARLPVTMFVREDEDDVYDDLAVTDYHTLGPMAQVNFGDAVPFAPSNFAAASVLEGIKWSWSLPSFYDEIVLYTSATANWADAEVTWQGNASDYTQTVDSQRYGWVRAVLNGRPSLRTPDDDVSNVEATPIIVTAEGRPVIIRTVAEGMCPLDSDYALDRLLIDAVTGNQWYGGPNAYDTNGVAATKILADRYSYGAASITLGSTISWRPGRTVGDDELDDLLIAMRGDAYRSGVLGTTDAIVPHSSVDAQQNGVFSYPDDFNRGSNVAIEPLFFMSSSLFDIGDHGVAAVAMRGVTINRRTTNPAGVIGIRVDFAPAASTTTAGGTLRYNISNSANFRLVMRFGSNVFVASVQTTASSGVYDMSIPAGFSDAFPSTGNGPSIEFAGIWLPDWTDGTDWAKAFTYAREQYVTARTGTDDAAGNTPVTWPAVGTIPAFNGNNLTVVELKQSERCWTSSSLSPWSRLRLTSVEGGTAPQAVGLSTYHYTYRGTLERTSRMGYSFYQSGTATSRSGVVARGNWAGILASNYLQIGRLGNDGPNLVLADLVAGDWFVYAPSNTVWAQFLITSIAKITSREGDISFRMAITLIASDGRLDVSVNDIVRFLFSRPRPPRPVTLKEYKYDTRTGAPVPTNFRPGLYAFPTTFARGTFADVLDDANTLYLSQYDDNGNQALALDNLMVGDVVDYEYLGAWGAWRITSIDRTNAVGVADLGNYVLFGIELLAYDNASGVNLPLVGVANPVDVTFRFSRDAPDPEGFLQCDVEPVGLLQPLTQTQASATAEGELLDQAEWEWDWQANKGIERITWDRTNTGATSVATIHTTNVSKPERSLISASVRVPSRGGYAFDREPVIVAQDAELIAVIVAKDQGAPGETVPLAIQTEGSAEGETTVVWRTNSGEITNTTDLATTMILPSSEGRVLLEADVSKGDAMVTATHTIDVTALTAELILPAKAAASSKVFVSVSDVVGGSGDITYAWSTTSSATFDTASARTSGLNIPAMGTSVDVACLITRGGLTLMLTGTIAIETDAADVPFTVSLVVDKPVVNILPSGDTAAFTGLYTGTLAEASLQEYTTSWLDVSGSSTTNDAAPYNYSHSFANTVSAGEKRFRLQYKENATDADYSYSNEVTVDVRRSTPEVEGEISVSLPDIGRASPRATFILRPTVRNAVGDVTYAWGNMRGMLQSSTGHINTGTAPATGQMTINLVVTDSLGNKAETSITIIVSETPDVGDGDGGDEDETRTPGDATEENAGERICDTSSDSVELIANPKEINRRGSGPFTARLTALFSPSPFAEVQLQHMRPGGSWRDIGPLWCDAKSPLTQRYTFTSEDQLGDHKFRTKHKVDADSPYEYSNEEIVTLSSLSQFGITLESDIEVADVSSSAVTANFTGTYVDPTTVSSLVLQELIGGTWTDSETATDLTSPTSFSHVFNTTDPQGVTQWRLKAKPRASDTDFSYSNTVSIRVVPTLATSMVLTRTPARVDLADGDQTVDLNATWTGHVYSLRLQRRPLGLHWSFPAQITVSGDTSWDGENIISAQAQTGTYEYRVAFRSIRGGQVMYSNVVQVVAFRTSPFSLSANARSNTVVASGVRGSSNINVDVTFNRATISSLQLQHCPPGGTYTNSGAARTNVSSPQTLTHAIPSNATTGRHKLRVCYIQESGDTAEYTGDINVDVRAPQDIADVTVSAGSTLRIVGQDHSLYDNAILADWHTGYTLATVQVQERQGTSGFWDNLGSQQTPPFTSMSSELIRDVIPEKTTAGTWYYRIAYTVSGDTVTYYSSNVASVRWQPRR